MRIGIPKEIKNHEYRVGLTPASAHEFIANGHQVFVETHAGEGIDFSDDDYRAAGVEVLETADDVFKQSEMIVKVKEPQAIERARLKSHHTLFTYLHLAPDIEQAHGLIKSGAVCIAYETVTNDKGGLPLLAPMSAVAGRMSIQAGAHSLEKSQGGRAVLIGGVPGVKPAKVVIIGGGVVGENAAEMAVGMGAEVIILDRSISVLRRLSKRFYNSIKTIYSTASALADHISEADLVIGAVLLPGAAAPKLLTRELIATMKKGAVIVDVAIDQGGCAETSRPTTHAEPTYIVDGIVHYCVANMPGAVARTSTIALNNATLPYAIALANKGIKQALQDDKHLLRGLNVCRGHITCEDVSTALNLPYVPAESVIEEL
ncbi:MAG: alanine dehydrogenase [Endozoicomonas sp. (ex Botrylloides leachii)]|nr:alanine dehydrogenase [Endozoicomonas sp. (ex Botrylloides leachii)]